LLGVVGFLLGLWNHPIKNASVLWLFPFAIGALMVHFAHNDYHDSYDALMVCRISLILLLTDKHFKVNIVRAIGDLVVKGELGKR
jgi:hypothetical protein